MIRRLTTAPRFDLYPNAGEIGLASHRSEVCQKGVRLCLLSKEQRKRPRKQPDWEQLLKLIRETSTKDER